MKTKLYYDEDGRMLYSRNWPEVPAVNASIYQDLMAERNFKIEMDFLLSHPVIVTNPDFAKRLIVWGGQRIERNTFYEIDCDFIIKGNTCELIDQVTPDKE